MAGALEICATVARNTYAQLIKDPESEKQYTILMRIRAMQPHRSDSYQLGYLGDGNMFAQLYTMVDSYVLQAFACILLLLCNSGILYIPICAAIINHSSLRHVCRLSGLLGRSTHMA